MSVPVFDRSCTRGDDYFSVVKRRLVDPSCPKGPYLPFPINNGDTFKGWVRSNPKSITEPPLLQFAITVLDAINGDIQLRLTASQTASIAPGKYYYDLEQSTPYVTTFMKGRFTIDVEVTRSV